MQIYDKSHKTTLQEKHGSQGLLKVTDDIRNYNTNYIQQILIFHSAT